MPDWQHCNTPHVKGKASHFSFSSPHFLCSCSLLFYSTCTTVRYLTVNFSTHPNCLVTVCFRYILYDKNDFDTVHTINYLYSYYRKMSRALLKRHLECPVCFEVFGKKVFQCKKGHSFCSICSETLDRCPTCTEAFSGARNFILEAIMRDMKDEEENGPRSSTPPTPKIAGPSSDASSSSLKFWCRSGCGARLSLAKLYSHLGSNHGEFYSEYKFTFSKKKKELFVFYDFDLVPTNADTYRYFRIPGTGLFALIFRVEDIVAGKRRCYCWIQRASVDYEARKFSVTMTAMMFDDMEAEYTDYVHGEQFTEDYIMSRRVCLFVEVPINHMNTLSIDMRIFETKRGLDDRRNYKTSWYEC